jgi:3-oxoacyl-[acyl-carrier protein] reductase
MTTTTIDPGLSGRVVLVTGANNPRGIGAATARAFARAGASVFLQFLREPGPSTPLGAGPSTPLGAGPAQAAGAQPGDALYRALKSRDAGGVVEEIRQGGGTAESLEIDLTATPGIAELFECVETTLGPLDILVNNAAHCSFDTFLPGGGSVFGAVSLEQASPLSAESHDAHFAVNSRATALLMAEYARRHVARGATWGRIVNVSTDASGSHPGAISYGASKHALESYSRAAAWELGRYGITVNVVAPGPVQTGWIGSDLEAQVLPSMPLGRVGTPEDIADVILFFASEQARWVTGQTLYVGGGHVMPI